MALKWVPWESSPRLYIDLKDGRKTVATIARTGRAKGGKWPRQWQVVVKFTSAGGMPGRLGPIFPSRKAAMDFVEARLNRRAA